MMNPSRAIVLGILACFALASQAQRSPLLMIESVYVDAQSGERTLIQGSGFLVNTVPAQGAQKIRNFVVTNSHLVQGEEIRIRDAAGVDCAIGESLIDTDSDLAIFAVSGCDSALTFDLIPAQGIYTHSNRTWGGNLLIGPTDNRVSWISDSVSAANAQGVFQWRNMLGDLVTNLEVYPGQSGSPFFQNLDAAHSVTYRGLTYNTALVGVGKGSWRFFRMSKVVDATRLIELFQAYAAGARGSEHTTRWVMRAGILNQEIADDVRDASLQTVPRGNGISIDSGGSSGTSVAPADRVRADLERFRESGVQLGMIYQGRPIIAFRVLLTAPGGSSQEIFVYASMANLNYLTKRLARLKITGVVGVEEDLRPMIQARSGLNEAQVMSRLASKILEAGLDLRQPVRAADLFRVEEDEIRVWGWDFRNLFLLDFEELVAVSADQESRAWQSEWSRGFVKIFGVLKNTAFVIASVRDHLLKP